MEKNRTNEIDKIVRFCLFLLHSDTEEVVHWSVIIIDRDTIENIHKSDSKYYKKEKLKAFPLKTHSIVIW